MPAKKTTPKKVTKQEVHPSTMNRDELSQEISVANRDLFTLRMKHSLWELKQPHLIRTKRREIARMQTFLWNDSSLPTV